MGGQAFSPESSPISWTRRSCQLFSSHLLLQTSSIISRLLLTASQGRPQAKKHRLYNIALLGLLESIASNHKWNSTFIYDKYLEMDQNTGLFSEKTPPLLLWSRSRVKGPEIEMVSRKEIDFYLGPLFEVKITCPQGTWRIFPLR